MRCRKPLQEGESVGYRLHELPQRPIESLSFRHPSVETEVLTSAGQGRGSDDYVSAPIANSSKHKVNNGSLVKEKTVAVSNKAEPQGGNENDVESYLDERGRL